MVTVEVAPWLACLGIGAASRGSRSVSSSFGSPDGRTPNRSGGSRGLFCQCWLGAALFSTAVAVTQTMSVWVAAVSIVTTMVETTVDVDISATTATARCVATHVTDWVMVDVTVTVPLSAC